VSAAVGSGQAPAGTLAQAAPRHTRRTHLIFGGILLVHVLLGLGVGLNSPPFESTDEPGHYLFVRYLQAYHRLPVQTKEFFAPRAHHPPGYYLLGALISGWVSIPGSPDAIQTQPNPKFGFRVADPGNDNKAVYLHNGPDERFPFQGQALAIHLIRLVSLALSAIAVVATYGAARELRPTDELFWLVAAALVAFNPMVLYMSGVVSNDTGALVGGALAIYLVCRGLRRGFSLRGWAGVGVALGLALLLKSSALVLLAPIGLALLIDALRAGGPRLANAVRRFVASGVALGVPPALLAGWWFVRNHLIYGDFTGNAAMIIMSGRTPRSQYFVDLSGKISWVLKGILGCAPLGPLSLCFATPVYWVAALLALVALAGALMLLRSAPASLGAWPARGDWGGWARLLALPAVGLWLVLLANIAATAAATFAIGETCPSCWAGRYMFPAFTSLAMLLAAGWLAWFPRRWRSWAGAGLMLLSLAASAYGLFGLIIPRYNIPPSPSAGEISRAAPLDAQVGDVARVLAYRIDSASVKPGGVLAVTVYWQVLARTAQPYTVFIHIFSPDTGSIAQRDTYPGLGNYATTVWDPGRTFVDTYRLYLPPGAPAAANAMILLGLYDGTSGQRLPVTGKDAGPAADAWVQFGQVAVQP